MKETQKRFCATQKRLGYRFEAYISEVTFHRFPHILFIRSQALGPAHIPGKGLV